MSNSLDRITPSLQDMNAEFMGMQYMVDDKRKGKKKTARYNMFRASILKLVYSNFKWYGLENYEVNAIENLLIKEGVVCAVKTYFDINSNTPDGVMFGRVGNNTNLPNSDLVDFYGNPLTITCSGMNGVVFTATNQDDFCIGFDNCANDRKQKLTPPVLVWINNLASELDDAFGAWKVACETRKMGLLFEVSNKRQADLLRKVLKSVSENDPYIIIEGDITDVAGVHFAPNFQGQLSEFYTNFMNVWGSVMDLLGLENNSQNKRERMIVSEMEMNRSLSRYLAADRLRARKDFADEMNKKFNTNIRVENYLASVVTESPNNANEYGDKLNIESNESEM